MKTKKHGIVLSVLLTICLSCSFTLTAFAQELAAESPSTPSDGTEQVQDNQNASVVNQETEDETQVAQDAEAPTYQSPTFVDAAHPEKGMTWSTLSCPETYTTMTASTTSWSDGQWIVVESSLKVSSIEVSGTVNLVLKDGTALEVEKGIHVGSSAGLNIYGQEQNTGALTVKNSGDRAAIGSNSLEANGAINIYGGKITATGGSNAAGIGSGKESTAQNIQIFGGTVVAQGGSKGAGIGSGYKGNALGINIYGGTVTAKGGSEAPGIGCGSTSSVDGITISGGTIVASGGSDAAAIGAGKESSVSNILISGGKITATGGSKGAGIGSGFKGSCDGITISSGSITATGGKEAAGIGGSFKTAVSNITISNGAINATSGSSAAAIGSGKEGSVSGIHFDGGAVSATKGKSGTSGIGAGQNGTCSDITVNFSKAKVWNATSYELLGTTGDFTSKMGTSSIVITNGTITPKGVTTDTSFGRGVSYRDRDVLEYLVSSIKVIPSGGLELMESQAQTAGYILGITDDELIEIIGNPNKTIEISLKITVEIVSKTTDLKGNPTVEYYLRTDGTCVLYDAQANTKVTKTREISPEAFANAKGTLTIILPVRTTLKPTLVLHTSNDGTQVFDSYTAFNSPNCFYDTKNSTLTIVISHCSNIKTSFTEKTSVPATSDTTQAFVLGLVGLIIAAGAIACASRKKARS